MAGCRGQGCHSISDGAARASPWCHSSARLCGPEPVTLPQWASHCVLGRVTALTDVHVCARIPECEKGSRTQGGAERGRRGGFADMVTVKDFEMASHVQMAMPPHGWPVSSGREQQVQCPPRPQLFLAKATCRERTETSCLGGEKQVHSKSSSSAEPRPAF